MHGKIVQLSSLQLKDGTIVLYAVNDIGKVYEKIVSIQNSPWTAIP